MFQDRMAAVISPIRAALRNRFFLWNLFGNIGPLLISVALIPYIYHNSSKEYVGFITITWAAIGYTGLFDFGLSRALFYFSSLSKRNNDFSLTDVVRKSVFVSLLVALFVNIVLLLITDDLAKMDMFRNRDQFESLRIIIFSLPVYLISNLLKSSLEGLELFKEANIFKFVAYASLFLCPALLIFSGNTSLSAVCISYGIVRLIASVYVMLKLFPHISRSHKDVSRSVRIAIGAILGFGGWATVSSTISPLMVYGDRFTIAYFSGASSIAVYALLQEMIGKTILLSSSYVTAIQPKLAYLPTEQSCHVYKIEKRNIVYFSILAYIGCAITSPFAISLWLQVSIQEVIFLAILMSVGFMFNSMAQAPLAYLLARGHPRRVAYSHITEAVIYFPLLIVAVIYYGIPGAATVGVFRQILDYGLLSWQAQRQID